MSGFDDNPFDDNPFQVRWHTVLMQSVCRFQWLLTICT